MNEDEVKVQGSVLESLEKYMADKNDRAFELALASLARVLGSYDGQLRKNKVPIALRKYLLVSLQSQMLAIANH